MAQSVETWHDVGFHQLFDAATFDTGAFDAGFNTRGLEEWVSTVPVAKTWTRANKQREIWTDS